MPVYGGEHSAPTPPSPSDAAVPRLGHRAVPGRRLPQRGDTTRSVHRGRAARRGGRRGQPGGQLPARVPGRGTVRAREEVHPRRRNFLLRYAPLPGNAILTERTIPARWCWPWGSAPASCSGPCCGCWPRSAPSTGRSAGWPAPTASPGWPTGGPGTRSSRASWPGRPAPGSRCASPCSTSTTSRTTTTSTATRRGTGCSRRPRRREGGCARPTCWPATAGRSSPSCCPTRRAPQRWRSPSGSAPPSRRSPARSGWPTGTAPGHRPAGRPGRPGPVRRQGGRPRPLRGRPRPGRAGAAVAHTSRSRQRATAVAATSTPACTTRPVTSQPPVHQPRWSTSTE